MRVASWGWTCNWDEKQNISKLRIEGGLATGKTKNYGPSFKLRVDLQLGNKKLWSQLRVEDGLVIKTTTKQWPSCESRVDLQLEWNTTVPVASQGWTWNWDEKQNTCLVVSRGWACKWENDYQHNFKSKVDLQLGQLRNYEPSCESRVDLQLGWNKLEFQLRVNVGVATGMKDKTRAQLWVKGEPAIEIKQIRGGLVSWRWTYNLENYLKLWYELRVEGGHAI